MKISPLPRRRLHMTDDNIIEMANTEDAEDLKPKPPPRLAPRGIRTFTVCRQSDETGVSGEGVVIEGVSLVSSPRGGIAIFDSLDDFLRVHVKPHPSNKTIITFEDGEQTTYDGG